MVDFESSKLLIDEEPLQVLPGLAAVIGLNEAMVVQQLHYWLRRSKHEHDGRRWIYNTLGEWQVQFPFWNEPTLQRTMKNLTAIKLVIVHMTTRTITAYEHQCQRCQFVWKSFLEDPKSCKSCKSQQWRTKAERGPGRPKKVKPATE